MNLGELVFAPGMQYLPLCGLLSGPSSVDCGGGSRALRDAVGGRAGLPAAMEPGPSGRRVADGRLQSLGCCGHDRLQIAFVMACARRPLQPLHEQPVAVARRRTLHAITSGVPEVQGELPGPRGVDARCPKNRTNTLRTPESWSHSSATLFCRSSRCSSSPTRAGGPAPPARRCRRAGERSIQRVRGARLFARRRREAAAARRGRWADR